MTAIGKDSGARVAPRWRADPYSYAECRALAAELGLSETTASVLVRRGFRDAESAGRFLDAAETHDPFEFRGMEQAVALILEHVRRGSVIAVHGDYDVDGVCSTALAVRTLRELGGDVRARLPARTEEGYGLSVATVEELRLRGAELLLTADCGIGSAEEVAHARHLGMDVVVTDHHRPGPELPDCPLVHPGVCAYPCPHLCATGVVYKLSQALYSAAGRNAGELADELDIVALATVADVVPLTGENRTLVRGGLRALAGGSRPGLRALLRVAGVDPQGASEHTLGFVLAPRINAAGRLYRADAGLELLLTRDPGRAAEIARELDATNSERQAVETRVLFEAERQLSADPARRQDPLFVLAGEGWHPGVIGIVASRLVERYHRPCVLVALDRSGHGRGSGRSIAPYDLHSGLAACSSHLERFGGHRMAAGLEIDARRVERFGADLVAHARSILRPEDLTPVERVDAVVGGHALGLDLVEELERLRPFGMGNPAVNLLLPAARVADVRPIGEGRHARFTVTSAGVRAPVVAFGVGSEAPGLACGDPERRSDVIARLEANEWRGVVEPRLVLRSIHRLEAAADADEAASGGCAGCTCRARGAEWWRAVWAEFEADLEPREGRGERLRNAESGHGIGAARVDASAAREAGPRTIVDRRGQGIAGLLGDLLSGGEPLLVLCADVSRRRGLLEHELDACRFGHMPATRISARCSARSIAERLKALPEDAVCLADYATIEAIPGLLGRFTHVFALDPPPFERLRDLVKRSGLARAPESGSNGGGGNGRSGVGGGNSGSGFFHLGWGTSELEFVHRTLGQEYELRAPLAAIYRALASQREPIAGGALERLLAGEGRHPRSPALAGRCLRVLSELGLIGLERSSATVRCTIIESRQAGQAELERSETFSACAGRYQEALRFLGEPRQARGRPKAA